MRQPDINRVNRAIEHIKAARVIIENIKWENLTSRESSLRKSVYAELDNCEWTLNDILNCEKK